MHLKVTWPPSLWTLVLGKFFFFEIKVSNILLTEYQESTTRIQLVTRQSDGQRQTQSHLGPKCHDPKSCSQKYGSKYL